MLSTASTAILKSLCMVLAYMFKENMKFIQDYR